MKNLLQQLVQLKTRAPKRMYLSLFVIFVGLILSFTPNLLQPILKTLPGGGSVAEKFHFKGWDLALFLPLLLLWKNAPLKRGVLLWTGLLNFVFLHLFYTINGIVVIPALLLGWGLPFAYMAFALFRASWKHFHDKRFLKYFALSLCSWVVLALSYPPLPLGVLVFVALVPWMWAITRVSRGQAITMSFWSGFIHNAIMYYWIKNVIAVGPGVVVAIGLALLLSWFALFSVIGAFFVRRSHKWGAWGLLLFPLLAVGLEVARTFGEISFPWAHIAYTLGDMVEMIQISAWIGVFGLSFLILFSNYFVFWILDQNSKSASQDIGGAESLHLLKKPLVWAKAFSLPLVVVLVLWGLGAQILKNATLGTQTAKVALVQPAIVQNQKWDRKFYQAHMEKSFDLVKDKRHHDLDLIVLPETAIPNYKRFARKELNQLRQLVQQYNANLFTGILDFDKQGPPGRIYNFYNTGMTLRVDKTEDSYSKIRLVPFSEKLPWDDLFPVLNYVNLGEGDFRPGTETPVYDSIAWTPNICYETIYPSFVRANIRSGAKLIVNITNDGWFGRSTAPYQHLNLVRFRAVENGIPIARAANTGISAFIDEYGRVRSHTELYEAVSIVDEIPLKSRTTLYSQIGDLVEDVLFYLGLILLIVILNPWRAKRKDP